ncbi:MAG: hypothetical protein JJU02_02730 [Cryomorphaceae bacterium]|nr:hypothetical protein [Cryomorphaceae bacterium]
MRPLFYKYIVVFGLFFISIISTDACDMCSAGAGGSLLGIVPNFSQNLVGVRFQHQSFQHPNTHLNYHGSSRVLTDAMQRSDVWLRFYPTDRIQLLTFVPYQVNRRIETEHEAEVSGIGDISVQALYTIVNTGDSTAKNWKHTLLAGGEIRLPTGTYQQRDPVRFQRYSELFQIGTGAFAFGAQTMYTIRYKNWGWYSDAKFVTNSTNELDYKWGNQFFSGSKIFYWQSFRKVNLLPSFGILLEHMRPDSYIWNSTTFYQNGGQTTWAQFGIDFYSTKWMAQIFAHTPLAYNLPEGMPEAKWRMGFTLGFFF